MSTPVAPFVLLSLGLAGCQWLAGIDHKVSPGDGSGGASASSSVSTSGDATSSTAASIGTGGAAPACTVCGDACVDLTSDAAHCGSCKVACTGAPCDAGVCGRVLFRGTGSNAPSVVKADGSLWTWGDASYLQAGIVEPEALSSAPTRAALFDAPARYSASTGYTTCVLLRSGGVSCFGANTTGQVGVGTLGGPDACAEPSGCVKHPVPTIASGVAELAGGGFWYGYQSFCARMNDGGVKCWGQIGGACDHTGYLTDPVTVPGVTGAREITVGVGFACAIVTDGSVRCWGTNCSGQLGQGDDQVHASAVTVPGLAGVTAISAGVGHVCARAEDGLFCWGWDNGSQLGIGPIPDDPLEKYEVPKPARLPEIAGLEDVVQLASGFELTCALTAAGRVFCWGDNGGGNIGDGKLGGVPCPDGHSPCRLTPVRTLVEGAVEIAVGQGASFARLRDGLIVSWGNTEIGELGIDEVDFDPHPTPGPISNYP